MGISTQRQRYHPIPRKPIDLQVTLRQPFRIPRQHLRVFDQRRRHPIYRNPLRPVPLTQPMNQTMQRRFRRPIQPISTLTQPPAALHISVQSVTI